MPLLLTSSSQVSQQSPHQCAITPAQSAPRSASTVPKPGSVHPSERPSSNRCAIPQIASHASWARPSLSSAGMMPMEKLKLPMPQMMIRKLSVLLLASSLGCSPSMSSGSAPVPETGGAKGTLLIVGGGSQSDDLVRQFIALAGGPGKARIAILPMASSDPTTGPEKKAQLDSMGA